MKKLILITLLIFSSPSYAEWTAVTKTSDGYNFYVDFDTIRVVDGYLYFWYLSDFPEPFEGDLSVITYVQSDCKLFRSKRLQFIYHTENMGGGRAQPEEPIEKGWQYPPPDTVMAVVLEEVCSR